MVPTQKPTVQELKAIQLFRSFNDQELTKLITIGTCNQYEPHTNVVIEGELSWGVYVVLDGTVGVFKANKLTGESHDVGQLGHGNFFGEMSLIDENPRSATVKTLTEASLFYISKSSFMGFIDPVVDRKMNFLINAIRTLVTRFRELDENYVVSQYQLWRQLLERGEKK